MRTSFAHCCTNSRLRHTLPPSPPRTPARISRASILKHAGEAVDAKTAANRSVAGHDAGQGGIEDGGSMSSAVLAALPPNAFAITLFCLESRQDPDACLLFAPSSEGKPFAKDWRDERRKARGVLSERGGRFDYVWTRIVDPCPRIFGTA